MTKEQHQIAKTRDWVAIRHQYETGSMSQRDLADSLSIPQNTMMKRAMRERWIQRSKLVGKAAGIVEAKIKARVEARVQDELSPFIEAHKAKITRRAVRMSNRGLARLEKLWKLRKPDAAKSEAEGAKALETFVRVARVSLGMGDGMTPVGAVNVNILTQRSAVQVVDSASLGNVRQASLGESQDCE